jgi:fido (protein-threonine AMPylation protein)
MNSDKFREILIYLVHPFKIGKTRKFRIFLMFLDKFNKKK